jgi:protein SCO1/2
MTRLVVTLALALFVAAGCAGPKQMHGVMVEPAKAVPGFDFTLPSGTIVHTAPESGRPLLVFFGYTHCPDVCPTTLADWKRAKQKLGRAGERVRFLFVTVDPARDTPTIADQYAKQFDRAFIGVSGDEATTARMMTAFGVTAAKEEITDSTHYFVGHSAQAFLVDTTGHIIAMYPFGIGWDALAADLAGIL